ARHRRTSPWARLQVTRTAWAVSGSRTNRPHPAVETSARTAGTGGRLDESPGAAVSRESTSGAGYRPPARRRVVTSPGNREATPAAGEAAASGPTGSPVTSTRCASASPDTYSVSSSNGWSPHAVRTRKSGSGHASDSAVPRVTGVVMTIERTGRCAARTPAAGPATVTGHGRHVRIRRPVRHRPSPPTGDPGGRGLARPGDRGFRVGVLWGRGGVRPQSRRRVRQTRGPSRPGPTLRDDPRRVPARRATGHAAQARGHPSRARGHGLRITEGRGAAGAHGAG